MKLVILTPEKEFFNGLVKSVTVPGISGEFEVLANHAPLVSALISGLVKVVKENGDIDKYDISQGFLEVINNDLALLVHDIKSVE